MARRRGIEPMHDEHVNVTPLIDVVMCLIIFFMICGQLVKDEMKAGIDIPKASNQTARPLDDQRGRLVINLVPRVQNPGDPINPMTEPEVYVRSRQVSMAELGEELRREKTVDPDVKVILRADRAISYRWISPVLVNCAQTGIASVNFSVVVQ